ncbi:MAG: GTPase ObgE, partial [Bdellovibrionaceae bacterium]|nr:GTPase ObgE [Pseudobdellovibrionaceae bacterium]
MKFIDEVNILVASGNGGPGCVSFRREFRAPRGGPDGGDGGKGGDVVFKVNSALNSLMDLRYSKVYRAANGSPGMGSQCSGSDGQDLVIQVPPGTVIKDKLGHILADLNEENKEVILLNGGRGGKGNHFFKSSVNQAPDKSQPGEKGIEQDISLELKLLADVGLIGFPNAGKSTFISKVSAAKPKIADYPFTTLVPNLGVVKLETEKSFVIADIPGLIEGAAQGMGLGTQFLRHIERTRVFIHLIDMSEFNPRDPYSDYLTINKELKAHDDLNKNKEAYTPLSQRPQIVVLNKVDSVSEEYRETIEEIFRKHKVP